MGTARTGLLLETSAMEWGQCLPWDWQRASVHTALRAATLARTCRQEGSARPWNELQAMIEHEISAQEQGHG